MLVQTCPQRTPPLVRIPTAPPDEAPQPDSQEKESVCSFCASVRVLKKAASYLMGSSFDKVLSQLQSGHSVLGGIVTSDLISLDLPPRK